MEAEASRQDESREASATDYGYYDLEKTLTVVVVFFFSLEAFFCCCCYQSDPLKRMRDHWVGIAKKGLSRRSRFRRRVEDNWKCWGLRLGELR